jgi:hypothetical protein
VYAVASTSAQVGSLEVVQLVMQWRTFAFFDSDLIRSLELSRRHSMLEALPVTRVPGSVVLVVTRVDGARHAKQRF